MKTPTTRVLAFLIAAVPGASTLAQERPRLSGLVRYFVSVDAPLLALTHATVIDGTGTAAVSDQTILIRDGRIQAMGRAGAIEIPESARVIDLSGHTVFPGFVGMHNHTYYETQTRTVQLDVSAPRLYLAGGVTTIRTTGSISPYSEISLKRAIDLGEVPGPRMFITGPYLTGSQPPLRAMQTLSSVEEARRTVNYWADEGATWLKFYTTVNRANMKAVIDEAHRRGLKVTGHLCSVTFREAVALGIDNLEHGLYANTDYVRTKAPDACPAANVEGYDSLDVASASVQQTFRDLVANGVAMTSTLAVFEQYTPHRPLASQRALDAMSPEVRAEYLATRNAIDSGPAGPLSERLLRRAMEYERAFVRGGGILVAGVDPTGIGGALPGFGDQRNFELLIEAGFAPEMAIRILTLNGAKVLGIDAQVGSIAPGKDADLVVVRGNPVNTPSDIANTVTVFKHGVGYDSAKLIASVRGAVGIR